MNNAQGLATVNAGYVYMLFVPRGTQLWLKIGQSSFPIKRAREIGGFRGNPIKVIWYARCPDARNTRALESALHRVYSDFHLTGEWFEFDMKDGMHKRFFNNAWKPLLRAFGVERWEKVDGDVTSHLLRAS